MTPIIAMSTIAPVTLNSLTNQTGSMVCTRKSGGLRCLANKAERCFDRDRTSGARRRAVPQKLSLNHATADTPNLGMMREHMDAPVASAEKGT